MNKTEICPTCGHKSVFIERWEEYYTRLNPYPCKIKGCIYKKRNGRCGRDMWRREFDVNGTLTGKCLDYKTRGNP